MREGDRPLVERGWRYTLIGLFCAAANYAVLLAVDWAGGHYMLGILIGFVIVSPTAYVLHSLFTFAEPFSLRALVRFVAGLATTYPVAAGMMVLLCSGMGLPVAIATPIATVALFIFNFVMAHWAIVPATRRDGGAHSR